MPIRIVPFFSPFTRDDWKDHVLEILKSTGAELLTPDKAKGALDVYIFVGTGGTERYVLDFLGETDLAPVRLLTHDANNSLPSALEIRAYLDQTGRSSTLSHTPLEYLEERFTQWNTFSESLEKIAQSRFAIFGRPSSWLVASTVDQDAVKKKWGFNILEYPVSKISDDLPDNVNGEFKDIYDRFIQGQSCSEAQDSDIADAGRVAQNIHRFVKEENLDVVTVECFTLLQETKISGCYALSTLNDLEGITAGCEGDIPSAFTMMVAKILTGSPTFMANVTDIDKQSNSAVLAHCTIATSLLKDYEITTHSETGLSVGIRGRLALQPVTVLKIAGNDLSKYWVSNGEITENLTREHSCRTQVRIVFDKPVDYFLNEALANHHIVVPGHHAGMIEKFMEFALGSES
jgi:L-fucose isomerase-like protein